MMATMKWMQTSNSAYPYWELDGYPSLYASVIAYDDGTYEAEWSFDRDFGGVENFTDPDRAKEWAATQLQNRIQAKCLELAELSKKLNAVCSNQINSPIISNMKPEWRVQIDSLLSNPTDDALVAVNDILLENMDYNDGRTIMARIRTWVRSRLPWNDDRAAEVFLELDEDLLHSVKQVKLLANGLIGPMPRAELLDMFNKCAAKMYSGSYGRKIRYYDSGCCAIVTTDDGHEIGIPIAAARVLRWGTELLASMEK